MNGDVPEGLHTVVWDGVDESGNRVGAGVYLCRMSDGAHARTIRMTLVDGGGVSGGTRPVMKPVSGVSHSDQATEYTITVVKEGYEDYTETEFLVSFEEGDIEKNMVLAGILPIADAGPDQEVRVGTLFWLDGSGSRPGRGGDLKFEWRKSKLNPDDIFFIRTDIQPKTGARVPGTYTFFLTVKEGTVDSLPDTMIVTVHDRDNPPFEDYGLELSLRLQLNKPSQDFTPEEIAAVDSLNHLMWLGKLTSLEGIGKMTELHWLSLDLNSLTDISPLAGLKKLRYLSVNQNRIFQDISPLTGLTELTYLDISSNDITDISPLENLVNIEYLNVRLNPFDDISPLKNLTKLKELYLSNSPVKSGVEYLNGLTNIEILWMSACGLTDIPAASRCTKVKYLFLSYNMLEDISFIEHMPDIGVIYLTRNSVSDISPLVRNPGIGEGDYISLRDNPLSETSINEHIPALRARGVNIAF